MGLWGGYGVIMGHARFGDLLGGGRQVLGVFWLLFVFHWVYEGLYAGVFTFVCLSSGL